MATPGTYYFDTASFSTATSLYTNEDLTTCAADGIYALGTIVRRQVNCVLEIVETCPSCVFYTYNKTTAKVSSNLACADTTSSSLYFNTSSPDNGDIGYSDTALTTPFAGASSTYGLDQSTTTPSFSVVISNTGVLSSKTTCVAPTPPTPTPPTPTPPTPPTPTPPTPPTPPTVYNYYSAAPCTGGATVYFRTTGSYANGESVKIDAYGSTCYEVTGGGAPSNTNDVTAAYANCTGCLPAPTPPTPPTPPPTPPTPPTPPVGSFTIYANSSSGTNPLQGWSSSTAACTGTGVPVTVYNSAGHSTVQQTYAAGNALYLDSALTTLYNGGNTYFTDANSGGNYFQVGPSGFIFTFSACPAPTPPTPPTPPPTPPTPVSTVSYNLTRCSDFTSYVSQSYTSGTFNSGERVQGSIGVFYIISGTTAATSGLTITATGLTGCP